MWIAAALLCTTIASSYLALNYNSKIVRLEEDYNALLQSVETLLEDYEVLTIEINLKIDYGNRNVTWYNATRVPLDANLLKATELFALVEYTISEFGAFITEINGIGGDVDKYWLWFYLDDNTGNWEYGPSGADQWTLHDGDTISWVYTGF